MPVWLYVPLVVVHVMVAVALILIVLLQAGKLSPSAAAGRIRAMPDRALPKSRPAVTSGHGA